MIYHQILTIWTL